MLPQEVIRHKRNGNELTKEEIDFFIQGVTNGSVSDAQIAAMTMAVFFQGLNLRETVDLTLAMRSSGDVLSWHLDGPVVDKHSTGGVGDKVSLMFAPIMAALGAYVPMISGRGLGHTGGTLDKFDSINGYQTSPSNELFQKTVQNVGCAIIGQTGNLAPADKKIYAVRDISATVESIPLITASILSKKLAAGLDCLVMDVKFGSGAFMEKFEDAKALAASICQVANGAGTKTTALLSDMNAVLGYSVGNALEVKEAVDYLKSQNVNKRLDIVVKKLCCEALVSCGLCADKLEALQKVVKVLSDGSALEKFAQMVSALGGSKYFIENPEQHMPSAKVVKPVFANKQGYISKMDTRQIGLLLVELKGGRTDVKDVLDYATGFTHFCQIGDKADGKTPLCFVHAQTEETADEIAQKLQKLITISDEKPLETPVVIEK